MLTPLNLCTYAVNTHSYVLIKICYYRLLIMYVMACRNILVNILQNEHAPKFCFGACSLNGTVSYLVPVGLSFESFAFFSNISSRLAML